MGIHYSKANRTMDKVLRHKKTKANETSSSRELEGNKMDSNCIYIVT